MRKKDVEQMNRFELINEVVRLTQLIERANETQAENSYLSSENHRLGVEIGRLQSQQVVIAQYLDKIGQEPGKEFWLDVADDLRCGRLVGGKFLQRASKRSGSERRTQAQGRRKAKRRDR